MGASQLFQIYYDAATRAALDPGFLPLDNTSNPRPDWYEFWVIRSFLKANTLEAGTWYAFLSPSFVSKTGLTADHVKQFLAMMGDRGEVALILAAWDQVAYFANPFEQGEIWHPGITALTQQLLTAVGEDIDLATMITHSGNFTFSNCVIAKAPYWQQWLQLADKVFDYIERGDTALARQLNQGTAYGVGGQAPLKAFIQERLPAILLNRRRYQSATFNTSDKFPIFEDMFGVDLTTRGVLQTCDRLKRRFSETGDRRFVELFREVRKLVATRFPAPADATAR